MNTWKQSDFKMISKLDCTLLFEFAKANTPIVTDFGLILVPDKHIFRQCSKKCLFITVDAIYSNTYV